MRSEFELALTLNNVQGASGYADLCIMEHSMTLITIDQSSLRRHYNPPCVLLFQSARPTLKNIDSA